MAVVSVTPKAPTGVSVSARGVRGPQGPALEVRDVDGVLEWRVTDQNPPDAWKSLIDIAQYVTDAEDARDLAQKWATEDEDVAVSGSLYSALHHALKSAASASAADGSAGAASSAKSDAEDARNLAADWAEKPDGQDVDGVGTRSAKHHAGQAGAAASTATGAAGIATTKAGEALGHAGDAGEARDKAADWAEGTTPGGPGTKSAKEHAQDAAQSALDAATFDPSSYTPTEELSDVALSGDYNDLDNKPSLGDAAAKNTGTTAGTVAAGDDDRITGALQAALLTTRGDLLFRNASAPARLAKGTAGQVLTMGANDPIWATPSPAGLPSNVVVATKTNTATRTSDAFANVSGLSVTITPSSVSSRILVFAVLAVGATSGTIAFLRLLRGSTPILQGDADGARTRVSSSGRGATSANEQIDTVPLVAIDSPATTSAVTYNVSWAANYDTNFICLNRSGADNDTVNRPRAASIIVAMEIGAAP